ncbi:MAG: hypothetical protein GF341_03430 [candidate division Zixibacteria bacterium]|nr:hypothetical protein [candidate division Zixibacteria bacterium]
MVRPIDLQDALSKTQAVLKITESLRANPENEQRTALVLTDQKNKDDQKKPTPTQHSDQVILHREKPDHREKGESQEQADDGTEEQESHNAADSTDDDEPLPPPSLDITV